MALILKLLRIKDLEAPKGTCFARVKFRDFPQQSRVFTNVTPNGIIVDEEFQWPIARVLEPDEGLEIEILQERRLAGKKTVALLQMGLQGLITAGSMKMTEHFQDTNHVQISATLVFEVNYISPEGKFEDWKIKKRDEDAAGMWEDNEDDDSNLPGNPDLMLESETNYSRSFDSNDDLAVIPQSPRLSKASGVSKSSLSLFSKKLFNKKDRKNDDIGEDSSLIDSTGDADSVKRYTMRDETEDWREQKKNLTDRDWTGHVTSSLMQVPDIQGEPTEEATIAPNSRVQDLPIDRDQADIITGLGGGLADIGKDMTITDGSPLKRHQYQLSLSMIECKHLRGNNINPIGFVQLGPVKKVTAKQMGTNQPFFNEFFTFDMMMPFGSLLDKVVTIGVVHKPKNILKPLEVVGVCKIDIGTVYYGESHRYRQKWIMLRCPTDLSSGPSGFMKIDIQLSGYGIEKSSKDVVPPKADIIENNLLMPPGLFASPTQDVARYVVRIFKADGLPQMDQGVMSGLKKVLTGTSKDLVDPFVEVTFGGESKRTSIKKNSYNPEWNEQIVFTDLFPSLCRRIKFQLFDFDNVGSEECIGTHYLSLETIMNNQYNGWLPTFGPTYVNLYGSSRTFSISEDENIYLNFGYGDGISYRGRILIQVKVEICDRLHQEKFHVEKESCKKASQHQVGKVDEFFLFGCFFDASMISQAFAGKPIEFEVSIGNAGNNVDGYNPSSILQGQSDSESDSESVDEETKSLVTNASDAFEISEREANDSWESLTRPRCRLESKDKYYYSTPWRESKPCIYIRSHWEDQRARLYVQNMLSKIVNKLNTFSKNLDKEKVHIDGMKEKLVAIENVTQKLVKMLDDVGHDCSKAANTITGYIRQPTGRTQLDKSRREYIKKELDYVATMARTMKVTIRPTNVWEKRKELDRFLQKLQKISNEPQHNLPDVFIWMLVGGERAAYVRIPARDIMFSTNAQECGKHCGRMHTLFLRLPGLQGVGEGGWAIQARVQVYLWMGLRKHKKHFLAGMPPGFKETDQICESRSKQFINPPLHIDYLTANFYEVRAHIYQARNLLGMDETGLSDPYCHVCFADVTGKTRKQEKNLNPIFDQLIIFDKVILYGTVESIQADPPAVVLEVFDHDDVGRNDFLGRVVCEPIVKRFTEHYEPPKLQWHPVIRGDTPAGDLLAVFELFQLAPLGADDESQHTALPELRFEQGDYEENHLPLPISIRPVTSWHRLEILFWGIREIRSGLMCSVRRPVIVVECNGEVIHSESISDVSKNPNFNHTGFIKHLDVPLPEDPSFCPPLTIKCVEQKTFGRYDVVGTHIVQSVGIFNVSLEDELSINELENAKLRWKTLKESRTKGPSFLTASYKDEDSMLANDGLEDDDSAPFEVPEDASMIRKPEGDQEEVIDEEIEDLDWWSKYYATLYGNGELEDDDGDENEDEENELKIAAMQVEHNRDNPLAEPITDREVSMRRSSRRLSRRASRRSIPSTEASISPDVRQNNLKNTALTMLSKTKEEVSHKYAFVNKAFAKDEDNLSLCSQESDEQNKICRIHLYANELEAEPNFDNFDDVLRSFDLHKGKVSTDDDADAETRVCGKFKGNFKLYKIPNWIIDCDQTFELWEDDDDVREKFGPLVLSQGRGIPLNEQKKVKVFAYILQAKSLHPADITGKADPFPVVKLGQATDMTEKANYIPKNLNPIFGKCFTMEASFPQDSLLTVQIYDWDAIGSNDLIGETKVDLEKRFYSRHRAKCGISQKYETVGYNKWRDPIPPTKILAKLCKESNLSPPVYDANSVKINGFKPVKLDKKKYGMNGEEAKPMSPPVVKECLALEVLLQWKDRKLGGYELVPEYVESRPLFLPTKPGIEQGRVEMWVDIFPMDQPIPDPVNVQPRHPKRYELRCTIWNTDDCKLTDYNYLTGKRSADLYVKGWVLDDKVQSTDVHYMSLTGEGNFNWRFVFRFDFLVAEERIVIKKKTSFFDLDETEFKLPPRITLQVWDLDLLGDDFIGDIIMDMKKMPRPAKSPVECKMETVEGPRVKYLNLFKTKRAKGWWPFIQEEVNEDTGEKTKVLTGKVEAEFHLVELEEAEEKPVGLEREAPVPLDKPNRPETSYSWFLMPLKSFWFVFMRRFKKVLLIILFLAIFILFAILFLYEFPGAVLNNALRSMG